MSKIEPKTDANNFMLIYSIDLPNNHELKIPIFKFLHLLLSSREEKLRLKFFLSKSKKFPKSMLDY